MLSCSIGIAHYPQHGAQSALITHAAVATRAAKAAGGATYAVLDARMVDDVREQAELLADLRMALARDQLELYYQPKIHAPRAQVTAAEALLRWHHPRRGMISPGIFIPIAERSGLIHAIGLRQTPAVRPEKASARQLFPARAWSRGGKADAGLPSAGRGVDFLLELGPPH